MKIIKKSVGAACVAALFGLAVAGPAVAQQQEGLINVNVSDIDVGVIANVQVPVAVAANVCGVAVNVLAEQLPGDVECDADAESAAENRQFMQFAERQGEADAIREAAEE
jgi:hypothetical protein